MKAEIIRYLESVSSLYPGGVPMELISERAGARMSATLPLWGSKAAKLLIAAAGGEIFSRSGEPFSGERGELLLSSIERGLKLDRKEVALLGLPPGSDGVSVQNRLDQYLPKVILVLGKENWGIFGLRGKSSGRFHDADVIASHSLKEIAASPECKRQYWEDLKIIIGKLRQVRL